MQNLGPKQQGWLTRFQAGVVALMANADSLTELCNEYADDTFGTGGANAITDATVQTVIPACTAAQVASAEGTLAGNNAILATIAANRGYLEAIRP